MKRITYQIQVGREPEVQLISKSILCTDDTLASNRVLAEAEAFEGKVTVTDEPLTPDFVPSAADRLDALEAAVLAMMGGMTNV